MVYVPEGEIVDDADELVSYIQNSEPLYLREKEFRKNLYRKIAAGKYDSRLAPKLWKYLADEAADEYLKEFGRDPELNQFHSIGRPVVREYAGKRLAAIFEDEFRAGEYDEEFMQYAPKKYEERVVGYIRGLCEARDNPQSAASQITAPPGGGGSKQDEEKWNGGFYDGVKAQRGIQSLKKGGFVRDWGQGGWFRESMPHSRAAQAGWRSKKHSKRRY